MSYLTDLTQLPKVPVDMTLEALAATGREQQSEKIGLQELMRRQQFEQQADPMRLQRMQTDNDMGLQQLHTAKRSNREADASSPARMMAEYQGFLAKASDDDVKLAANKFQQMALSNDPKQRAIGEAGLKQTKDFIMERQKDAAALQRSREGYASAERIANIRSQAQLAAAQARRDMQGAKSPKDFEELAARYAQQGLAMPPGPERDELIEQARFATAMAERLTPTKPILSEEAGGGLFTDPKKQPMPDAPKKGGYNTQQNSWIERAMKANPGMSREDVEKQGKALGKL